MRSMIKVGVAVVIGAVAVLWPGVGQAGRPVTLEVTKSVVGTVPPGTTFTVQIDCDVTKGADEGGPTTQTIEFDAGGGTQSITVPQFQPTCTVQELDTDGFFVLYSGGADSDDTCTFADNGDSIGVSFPGAQLCQVEILNEVDSVTEPPPVTPPPPPPPPPPAEPAPLQPAFTG